MHKKEFLRGKPFDEVDALLMQNFIEDAISNTVKDIIGIDGVTSVSGFKPTGNPTNMTVNIALGVGYNSSGDRLTFSNGLSAAVSLIPANSVFSRIDVITIEKTIIPKDNRDSTNKYELGTNFIYSRDLEVWGKPKVYTGIASSSPVRPTIPANEIQICDILVKANSKNTGEAGIITDKRKFINLPLSGSTSDRPVNPFNGQLYYDTTIQSFVFYNGVVWKELDGDVQAKINAHENKVDIHTTKAEKDKLAGIANNANNYVHPNSHPPSIITQDQNNRFMTDTERNKLANIANNANNYIHPSTHPASMITQDQNNRFMTDAERDKLSNIAPNANNYTHPSTHPPSIIAQNSTNRFMTDLEREKLEGIETGATKYIHPSTHPASIISITDSGKYFSSSNVDLALQEIGFILNASRGSLINSINKGLGG